MCLLIVAVQFDTRLEHALAFIDGALDHIDRGSCCRSLGSGWICGLLHRVDKLVIRESSSILVTLPIYIIGLTITPIDIVVNSVVVVIHLSILLLLSKLCRY